MPMRALRSGVDDSFERITVDGQMSTNDTVLLQASGAAGRPLPPGLLDAVLLQLALDVVADGEGATRVGQDRGHRGRGRRRGRAHGEGDRQLAAGQDRAPRARPQLGPDRPGRRHGARRAPTCRSSAPRRSRPTSSRSDTARAGDRAAPGARRRRRSCLLLGPDRRVRANQLGVHDMTSRPGADDRSAGPAGGRYPLRPAPASARCSRPCRTSASSTADGGDQVRRRGDA